MKQFKITNTITRRDSRSIEVYFNEVSAIERITPEEEAALAQRIQQHNDIEALDRLVTANLRFVISVAKHYQNSKLPLIDLISEGNIGLIKAAHRYDGTKGFRFISYAVWWIRQCIIEAIADNNGIVRLPHNRQGEVMKINNIISGLEQELQREPTVQEIAETLELRLQEVDEAIRVSQSTVWMDAPVAEGGAQDYYQLLADDKLDAPARHIEHKESLSKEIRRLLGMLNQQEATVVRMFFGIGQERPMTTDEIADVYGVSVQRIRQIKQKAIRVLRQPRKARHLRGFLE